MRTVNGLQALECLVEVRIPCLKVLFLSVKHSCVCERGRLNARLADQCKIYFRAIAKRTFLYGTHKIQLWPLHVYMYCTSIKNALLHTCRNRISHQKAIRYQTNIVLTPPKQRTILMLHKFTIAHLIISTQSKYFLMRRHYWWHEILNTTPYLRL